jgi:hypothetical protein
MFVKYQFVKYPMLQYIPIFKLLILNTLNYTIKIQFFWKYFLPSYTYHPVSAVAI